MFFFTIVFKKKNSVLSLMVVELNCIDHTLSQVSHHCHSLYQNCQLLIKFIIKLPLFINFVKIVAIYKKKNK